jgi:hypothetical protein
LLAKANTGTPIEGKIFPAAFGVLFPTFGSESVSIGTPKILAAVHGVDAVEDWLTLRDEDWALAVRTTADRKGGVFDCDTEVKWDWRLEAEHCVVSESVSKGSLVDKLDLIG